ncbi:MAG: hypothetical protein U9R27_09470 [Campylobacterota bacterium]|nr:hypothetical protein [Campylobacterota bacterium]
MKKTITLITLLISLVGCGGGSSSSSGTITPIDPVEPVEPVDPVDPDDPKNPKTISMTTNEVYQVFPGDKIEKRSEGTRVKIAYFENKTASGVELIEGSAEIIRSE